MRALFIFWCLATLTACGPITITLPYHPVTTEEVKGTLEVKKFSYNPSGTNIKQNQIRNTAAGTCLLTENIDDFFTNAVKRELRQAGLSLKSGAACHITGELHEFTIDDLGFSATYITKAYYYVKRIDGRVEYESQKEVSFDTSKFVVADVLYANLNKVVSDNIGKMLSDQAFQKAVERCNAAAE